MTRMWIWMLVLIAIAGIALWKGVAGWTVVVLALLLACCGAMLFAMRFMGERNPPAGRRNSEPPRRPGGRGDRT